MNNSGFLTLNLANAWPRFTLSRLAAQADGTLTLARLPRVEGPTPSFPSPIAALEGPAGIGVDSDGGLYISDPVGHRIVYVDCLGNSAPLPCFGGEGSLPSQLRRPRGLLVGPRNALYIADSGNHRIMVIDLKTLQVRGVWGPSDPYADPVPGTAPGQFDEPWDLSSDEAGDIYVVDHGNKRIQKFEAGGRPIPAFWESMQRSGPPQEPAYIVTTLIDCVERLIVLDRGQRKVLIYELDGTLARQWPGEPELGSAAGLAFDGSTLYVGDTDHNRILAFDRYGRLLGTAWGYRGRVAVLTLDRRGRLLVHSGLAGSLTRLLPGQSYAARGWFVAGPYTVNDQAVRWQHLRVVATDISSRAQLQLFTYASADSTPPPPLLSSAIATPSEAWEAAPLNASAIWLPHEPAPYLWIAGILTGDTTSSPTLQQMRLEYNQEGWLRYLPPLYGQNDSQQHFLERFLAGLEAELRNTESLLDDLPSLFDREAAPDDRSSSWLDWLGGWLAFDLDKNWSEAKRRAALDGAFNLLGRRGTPEGLRHFIELYAGVKAQIEEPALWASVWSLGETSTLGFDTMLAPTVVQEAVLGMGATLDEAYVANEEDDCIRIFDDLAHHFCVQVYAADLAQPQTAERVRQVVEEEKPAHTTYHLCIIEPRMRVGFQARLGVDAIVAGPAPDLIVDDGRRLGVDTHLPLAASDSLLGQGAWVGHDTARIV